MKPIQKATIVGIITIIVYLSVVVITTPALEPLAAISAAFQINSIATHPNTLQYIIIDAMFTNAR